MSISVVINQWSDFIKLKDKNSHRKVGVKSVTINFMKVTLVCILIIENDFDLISCSRLVVGSFQTYNYVFFYFEILTLRY